MLDAPVASNCPHRIEYDDGSGDCHDKRAEELYAFGNDKRIEEPAIPRSPQGGDTTVDHRPCESAGSLACSLPLPRLRYGTLVKAGMTVRQVILNEQQSGFTGPLDHP